MTEPEYIPAEPEQPPAKGSDPARNLAVIVYILQGLSFFLGGITALVGVIINYIKLNEVRGTWIEPHFRWQIRTFWLGLLWLVIGTLTLALIIGWFILLGMAIWVIYRIVKGALALNDGQAPE